MFISTGDLSSRWRPRGWMAPNKKENCFRIQSGIRKPVFKSFLNFSRWQWLERVPIPEIAQGSFSEDGSQISYNRVSRENRTWKRYRGGLAQDIYLYDFKTKVEKKLTTFEGTDRIPMWIRGKVYFFI